MIESEQSGMASTIGMVLPVRQRIDIPLALLCGCQSDCTIVEQSGAR
jgi:hypothetical protein